MSIRVERKLGQGGPVLLDRSPALEDDWAVWARYNYTGRCADAVGTDPTQYREQ